MTAGAIFDNREIAASLVALARNGEH